MNSTVGIEVAIIENKNVRACKSEGNSRNVKIRKNFLEILSIRSHRERERN